jgi:hypothetical protein
MGGFFLKLSASFMTTYRMSLISAVCRSQNFLLTRALLNLLRKGLGCSKPATLPLQQTQLAHYVEIPTISKFPELPSVE